MNFYMWLFVVKKMSDTYSGAVENYKSLPNEEKMELLGEFNVSEWDGE